MSEELLKQVTHTCGDNIARRAACIWARTFSLGDLGADVLVFENFRAQKRE